VAAARAGPLQLPAGPWANYSTPSPKLNEHTARFQAYPNRGGSEAFSFRGGGGDVGVWRRPKGGGREIFGDPHSPNVRPRGFLGAGKKLVGPGLRFLINRFYASLGSGRSFMFVGASNGSPAAHVLYGPIERPSFQNFTGS